MYQGEGDRVRFLKKLNREDININKLYKKENTQNISHHKKELLQYRTQYTHTRSKQQQHHPEEEEEEKEEEEDDVSRRASSAESDDDDDIETDGNNNNDE